MATGKMKKIYPVVAGNTLDSHEKIVRKLTRRGAKIAKTKDESDVTIVFCPIVSRFETDINSALSSIGESEKVILVAMYHTFDKDYTIPHHRENYSNVILLVDCLFFEKKGLLSCPCNKKAMKMVRKTLGLRKYRLLPEIKSKKRGA